MTSETLPTKPDEDWACVHASCVAISGRGVLIIGASGAGKSGLALQLMAYGAALVADDRVTLHLDGDRVLADAAPHIRDLIEARGMGVLHATGTGPVPVNWVVDLDKTEPDRLPEPALTQVLGLPVPLLRGHNVPNLAAALVQLMKAGRVDPQWPNT